MTKLLLDANISYRVLKKINTLYPDAIHVSQTGLEPPASDQKIWEWAKRNQCIVVTNDSDFVDLLTFKGFPPKVILLKIGNKSSAEIAKILLDNIQEIIFLANSNELGLLEII